MEIMFTRNFTSVYGRTITSKIHHSNKYLILTGKTGHPFARMYTETNSASNYLQCNITIGEMVVYK